MSNNEDNVRPVVGLDVLCSEPGCSSDPFMHSPNDENVVHTTGAIIDPDCGSRVDALLDGDQWLGITTMPDAMTPEQMTRTAITMLKVAGEAKRLTIARTVSRDGAGE